MTSPRHIPVLLDRVVALLAPALDASDAVFVDATVGLGGHAEALLTRCPGARLVGLDRDSDALSRAAERLGRFSTRITLVHTVYDALPRVLADLTIPRAHGVLFDLGVSSMQLDSPERGFAYAADAPLDMRMDRTAGRTAADVLNTYSAAELAEVLARYGEERFARRIASAVVHARAQQPLVRSGQLVEIVRGAIPAPARRTGGNPAKRTFQALRIEVNDELGAWQRALPAALNALAVRGRIVVLSYHSLEDRITKQAFATRSVAQAPPDLPVVPERARPELRLLTRGAEPAGEGERARNTRAASVRLRAAERVREVA
jgi:16S rRNA (cytosine1402-N4)-methyltransferase